MTVNQLLENMDVEEFMGWIAYYKIKNEEQAHEEGGHSPRNREMTPEEQEKAMFAIFGGKVIE